MVQVRDNSSRVYPLVRDCNENSFYTVSLSEGMRADSSRTAGTEASHIRSTSLSAPVQLRSFSQINQVFEMKTGTRPFKGLNRGYRTKSYFEG